MHTSHMREFAREKTTIYIMHAGDWIPATSIMASPTAPTLASLPTPTDAALPTPTDAAASAGPIADSSAPQGLPRLGLRFMRMHTLLTTSTWRYTSDSNKQQRNMQQPTDAGKQQSPHSQQ